MSDEPNRSKRDYSNDLSLATACADGNESAWEDFGRSYFTFIYQFAQHAMSSPTEGEELATQVISDLWQRKRIGMYSGLSSLRTWLGTVISNAAINAMKRSKRTVPIDDDEYHQWEKQNPIIPEEDFSAKRRITKTIQQCLEDLPSQERLLLQLYYQQGLTLREMKSLVPITEASLSRRLNKIRERLRKSIKRKLGPDFDQALVLLSEMPSELGLDLQNILNCKNG